jgi:ubiquinone/menaquinone biosynthesis C-methylase UbiE
MVSLALDTPELARLYDTRGQRQYTHGRILISDLAVEPGHRVLDIGAGTGLLASHVADIVGASGSVIGIDPLPLRIAIANERARPNLRFQVGQAEDLSGFEAGGFDIVYLNSVFHWLPNKAVVLAEVERVLKPGGRIGLTTASLERLHSLEISRQSAVAQAGLGARAAAARSIAHRVGVTDVEALFRDAKLRALEVQIRSFVDYDHNVDEILEFSQSSSFGNDLSELSAEERARFRSALAAELERSREARGIRQERHLIFAIAEKPLRS